MIVQLKIYIFLVSDFQKYTLKTLNHGPLVSNSGMPMLSDAEGHDSIIYNTVYTHDLFSLYYM